MTARRVRAPKPSARERHDTQAAEMKGAIRDLVESISSLNRALRIMGERPVNVCMTPSDVPPFTWLRRERLRAAVLNAGKPARRARRGKK